MCLPSFQALPATRLESKTDSLAYNRVSVHLVAFKRALCEQAKTLADAGQWRAAADHAQTAWAYVRATPVWDNPPHNNVRRQCFKALSANCLHALKKGDCWGVVAELEALKER